VIFERRVTVDAPAAEVFAWHTRPGAFERLSPPWEPVRVVRRAGTVRDGDELEIRMKLGPLPMTWLARHGGFVDGVEFSDEQVRGPFAKWRHHHRVEPRGERAEMIDAIDYRVPLGALGNLVAGRGIRRRLERMFAYRHATLAADLLRHKGTRPMKIAVSGASGLVGTQLCAFLSTGGHEVLRLVRKTGEGIRWDPAAGTIDAAALEGVDAIVHLAGENVVGRWTQPKKDMILSSRLDGTRLLASTIGKLSRPPRVFVSASAIGYYGAHGDPATEETPAGDDFLADVCRRWEDAATPAVDAGARVVYARIGVVLTPAGGALKKLLPAFRAGLGGRVGNGKQALPWVAIDDVIGALHAFITDERWRGAVNIVAPEQLTQREFATILARVLHRPSFFPLPAGLVRLLFGEMADIVLLGGRPVRPARLEAGGFHFNFPSLEPALRHLLGRQGA
jgi:uncharacterized protein (TIGR01777 family)